MFVNNSLKKVEEKIEKYNDRFNAIQDDINSLKAAVNKLDETLNSSINKLSTKISQLETEGIVANKEFDAALKELLSLNKKFSTRINSIKILEDKASKKLIENASTEIRSHMESLNYSTSGKRDAKILRNW